MECRKIFERTYKGEEQMTNAEKIRAMTDEELMDCLFNQVSYEHVCAFCVPTMRVKGGCDGHCRNGILKWLQQPAEEVEK